MLRERFNSSFRITGQSVLFALAVLAIPHAWAQDEPVFRSTSEVVLVPATVLDKQGKPVSRLKREDFELRVDGKPVAITALDEVSGAPAAATNARRPLPDTVTNMVPVESSRRSWVVLLVDFINTAPTDRMELRKQLLKFLT